MGAAPKVFISYSHDSPEHMDRVLVLADRLRADGVDAQLDQYEVAPEKGWPRWMLDEVEAADFVLVVCTEVYERRFRGKTPTKEGRGVKWEGAILTQELYDAGSTNRRFIPLLFPESGEDSIPMPLRSSTWYPLGDADGGYEALYRHLTNQPAVRKPELGKLRQLESKPRQTTFEALGETPSYKSDEERQLGEKLSALRRQRKRLTIGGQDTTVLDGEILEVRRRLREGAQPKPGDVLGERFKLLGPVGKGGFAQVWRAGDEDLERLVAVKVLHGQFAEDRSKQERFFRGARQMKKLRHPGIVEVIEDEAHDGPFHFFVMEYVAGGDLRRAVLEGRLKGRAALEVVCQVGEALAFAHEQGVIHRDVKPANILLDEAGRPKLTDFDLVRAFDTTGGTRTGGMLGTFLYAAPEALINAKEAGEPMEVYGLGMTAAFVLYGRDLPATVMRDAEGFIGKLPCYEALRAVLRQAVAWEPADRFESMAALVAALRNAQPVPQPVSAAASPPAGYRGGSSSPSVSKSRRRWSPRWLLSAALVGVVVVVAVFLGELVSPPGEEGGGTESSPSTSISPPPPEPSPGDPWTEPALGMRFRYVPAGTFQMGSPESEEGRGSDERQHKVTLTRGFWMGETEVTQGQWRELMRTDPSSFSRCGADCPVESVNWYEAVAFANALSAEAELEACYEGLGGKGMVSFQGLDCQGYRLPTEAEWERAVRAGTSAARPGASLDGIGWYSGNSGLSTHRVGQKVENRWGLHGVLGNVSEWTWDWYGDYLQNTRVDPQGPEGGSSRVIRGGGWVSDARFCRSAYRGRWSPGSSNDYVGFRLARTSPSAL